ncbi:SH3 domain-containing kinase-binding protein 1 isoform X1 [Pundamilia nyererei]|uniref:SH3 domain-containing kinase-binding protein 1-like isoform X1 n=1 Tax=Pundamilia nyererei TaxID=303518 RepID=A0A9Y6M6K6_9CICH|nr:PREDICTED: SH3 domain-containing kinase-binding protein 1-like isoform X1 [Pundamilia nyererei]XP_013766903.1 PREDICTED: SH3 domain-containing kinase-binding protein 1-like isoform X1 [Pundamilia nyererei]XP_013766904.1 PREDICTED: SH3 domain-containing kinase-binding protein 1-like isoform X1 [Pundamilia nyererei]XP_013766905.1 PREDICTED: SH3 domain-containing kinase-binding protein 1-like isoform X1 [Pundamilia nyererei]
MGSYSSALIPDTEEFVSVVSITEKLNAHAAHAVDERLQSELRTLVTLMMEEERKKTRSEVKNSLPEGTQQTTQNGSIPPALETKTVPTESFSSLLPKAISAVLHPAPPAGINSQSSRNPEGHASPNLEQLQTELRDLKGQFEQMKTQHNKEIKLLMNELDEEKRIRLTLQMEIQRMKKHMSK